LFKRLQTTSNNFQTLSNYFEVQEKYIDETKQGEAFAIAEKPEN